MQYRTILNISYGQVQIKCDILQNKVSQFMENCVHFVQKSL